MYIIVVNSMRNTILSSYKYTLYIISMDVFHSHGKYSANRHTRAQAAQTRNPHVHSFGPNRPCGDKLGRNTQFLSYGDITP